MEDVKRDLHRRLCVVEAWILEHREAQGCAEGAARLVHENVLAVAACERERLLVEENAQLRAHLAQRTTALRKVAAHLEACGDCNTCLLDEQPDLHAELGALANLPDAPKGEP